MTNIHWYPGHIAKAEKQLKEKLNLVDIIIEVIDSRIPYSSRYKNLEKLCPNKKRLILMNKSDVSDCALNKVWAEDISNKTGFDVIVTNLNSKKDVNLIISKVLFLSTDIMKKRLEKGLLIRPTRVMVVGMPNVGKSSIINRLVKRAKAKTGAKAGVTREQQWVRINDKIELLDTPGIISTIQNDQFQALKLAIVNSIGENAYDSEFVAEELLKLLDKKYPELLKKYYGFNDDDKINLYTIAIKKNWLHKSSTPDIKRTSSLVLSAFRQGKIGLITLEEPDEYK